MNGVIEFIFDEHVPRAMALAVSHRNSAGGHFVKATQVGLSGGPPPGTPDPQLLEWCEEHGQILVSFDKKTMPAHFGDHLARGRHVPGVFFVKLRHSPGYVAEFLAEVAHASKPEEWVDRLFYVD